MRTLSSAAIHFGSRLGVRCLNCARWTGSAILGLSVMFPLCRAPDARAEDFSELPLEKTLQQFGPGDLGGVRLATFTVLETFTPVKRYALRLYGPPDEASGGLLTEIGVYATDDPSEASLAVEQVNNADCSARQVVLGSLGSGAGQSTVLGMAARVLPPPGDNRRVSQADPQTQHLRLFVLTRNMSGEPGRTPLYFRLVKEADTPKALCEPELVREALKHELARLDALKTAPKTTPKTTP